MRKVCHHKEDNDVQVSKNQSLTCVGVGIVAVAGAGVLGVAGVEAAVGWGLVLGTGCVEETVFAVGWTGVRGVTFGAGGSARSTLFSWRVMLSEWRGPHIQVTTFSLCRYLTQTKYSEFNCYFWDNIPRGWGSKWLCSRLRCCQGRTRDSHSLLWSRGLSWTWTHSGFFIGLFSL